MKPDKQSHYHWLDDLGSKRLRIPKRRIVFSPKLDEIILEICDMGGLWRLEKMFGFDSNENEPPPLNGHEVEIVALRDELKSKQRNVWLKVARIFGLVEEGERLGFDYHQDPTATIKALFPKKKRKRK